MYLKYLKQTLVLIRKNFANFSLKEIALSIFITSWVVSLFYVAPVKTTICTTTILMGFYFPGFGTVFLAPLTFLGYAFTNPTSLFTIYHFSQAAFLSGVPVVFKLWYEGYFTGFFSYFSKPAVPLPTQTILKMAKETEWTASTVSKVIMPALETLQLEILKLNVEIKNIRADVNNDNLDMLLALKSDLKAKLDLLEQLLKKDLNNDVVLEKTDNLQDGLLVKQESLTKARFGQEQESHEIGHELYYRKEELISDIKVSQEKQQEFVKTQDISLVGGEELDPLKDRLLWGLGKATATLIFVEAFRNVGNVYLNRYGLPTISPALTKYVGGSMAFVTSQTKLSDLIPSSSNAIIMKTETSSNTQATTNKIIDFMEKHRELQKAKYKVIADTVCTTFEPKLIVQEPELTPKTSSDLFTTSKPITHNPLPLYQSTYPQETTVSFKESAVEPKQLELDKTARKRKEMQEWKEAVGPLF